MKKNNFEYVFFIFIVLILTWPIFGAWLTIFNRHWIWLGLSFMISLFAIPQFYRGKQFLWLVIYMMFVALSYVGHGNYFKDPISVLTEFLFLCVPSAIICFFYKYRNEKYNHFLVIITLLFIIFVTVASFVFDHYYPYVIRNNFSSLVIGVRAPLAILERYGLSDYSLPHAIPVLIPVLAYHMRKKGNRLRQYLLYGGLIVLCNGLAYVSAATTPFLLALVITILSLMIRVGNTRNNILLLIIFGVSMVFLNSDDLVLSVIHIVDDVFGQSRLLHIRLMEIETSIIYGQGEGDLGSRSALYMKSIDVFFDNILIGGDGKLGGHSALLDHLGTLGLLGFIPYCAFIISEIKYIVNIIPFERRIFYFVSVIAAISMLAIKSMNNWQMWCFLLVIAPLILTDYRMDTHCQRKI